MSSSKVSKKIKELTLLRLMEEQKGARFIDLVEKTGYNYNTVNRIIRELENNKIIKRAVKGKHMVYKLTNKGEDYKEELEKDVGKIVDLSNYKDLFLKDDIHDLSFNNQLFNKYLLELTPTKGIDLTENFVDSLEHLYYVKDLLQDIKTQKNIYELKYPKELIKAVISVLLDHNMIDLKIKLNPAGVNFLKNYSPIRSEVLKNAELVLNVKNNTLGEIKHISKVNFSIHYSLSDLHLLADIRSWDYNFEIELPSLDFTEEEFKDAFPNTYGALIEMTQDKAVLRRAMEFIVEELDKWKIKQIEERKENMREYENEIKEDVNGTVKRVYEIVRKENTSGER